MRGIRCLYLQAIIIILRRRCLWTQLHGVTPQNTVIVMFSAAVRTSKPIPSGRTSSSTQNLTEFASLFIVPGKLISPTSPNSRQHDNIRQRDEANQLGTFSKVIRQQDRRRRFDSRKKQYSSVLPNASRPTLGVQQLGRCGGGLERTGGVLHRGKYVRGAKPTTHFQTRPRLGVNGAVPPLAYMPS